MSRDSNFACSAHRNVFSGKKKRQKVTFDTEDRERVPNGLQKKPKSIHLSELSDPCNAAVDTKSYCCKMGKGQVCEGQLRLAHLVSFSKYFEAIHQITS